MENKVTIDLTSLFKSITGEQAKLNDIDKYLTEVLKQAGEGKVVTLTGAAPIWMYLKIAHALHGKANTLLYSAPGQNINELEIFNHNPH